MKKTWTVPQVDEISVKMTEHGEGWGNDGNSKQNSGPGTSSGGGTGS